MLDSIRIAFDLRHYDLVLLANDKAEYVIGQYIAESHVGLKQHTILLQVTDTEQVVIKIYDYPFITVKDRIEVVKHNLDVAQASIKKLIKSALKGITPIEYQF